MAYKEEEDSKHILDELLSDEDPNTKLGPARKARRSVVMGNRPRDFGTAMTGNEEGYTLLGDMPDTLDASPLQKERENERVEESDSKNKSVVTEENRDSAITVAEENNERSSEIRDDKDNAAINMSNNRYKKKQEQAAEIEEAEEESNEELDEESEGLN